MQKYEEKKNWSVWNEITVQSSEHEAIMLSLNGFHLMSKTGPLWPVTLLALKSKRPVCENLEQYNFFALNMLNRVDTTET